MESKIPESKSGYMELRGAKKDADCGKVEVKGGISTALGCCDYFEPESEKVTRFRCGDCEYVEKPEGDRFFGEGMAHHAS